eukprot:TRINITY_DN24023_c0_g4_i3.p2 TRINITY_DN24023_c0_g4~~TRINITY_DN24023_c0_g4_i3.p2  ORF type:complete len:210 (-),score=-24.64 TRINITY_DN24023_c0_g4_i3:2300-2929(-)
MHQFCNQYLKQYLIKKHLLYIFIVNICILQKCISTSILYNNTNVQILQLYFQIYNITKLFFSINQCIRQILLRIYLNIINIIVNNIYMLYVAILRNLYILVLFIQLQETTDLLFDQHYCTQTNTLKNIKNKYSIINRYLIQIYIRCKLIVQKISLKNVLPQFIQQGQLKIKVIIKIVLHNYQIHIQIKKIIQKHKMIAHQINIIDQLAQ